MVSYVKGRVKAMWRAWFAVVLSMLTGCAKAPATSTFAPTLVKTNDGITHKFYRDVSFEAFLQQIPSNSVAHIDITTGDDDGPLFFALVVVPKQPVASAEVALETTFEMRDGQRFVKQWTTDSGDRSGDVTALFVFPSEIVDGKTKIIHASDADSIAPTPPRTSK